MSMSRFLDDVTASFMGSLPLGMEIMVIGDLNADFLLAFLVLRAEL